MKYFILIMLFCFQSFAQKGSWRDLENLKNSKAYWTKAICQNTVGNQCGNSIDLRREMKGLVDNLDSPKFLKVDQATCIDQESCQTLLEALDCLPHDPDAFGMIAIDFSEVYCAVPNGFNKMDGIVPDPQGIIDADNADVIKVAKDLEEANIKLVKNKMECGRSVLALLVIRNVPKGLTRDQKKTMKNTYRDVKEFLELGSLQEAKEEIQDSIVDGIIVTDADKSAMIIKIDECLAQ